ncbi:MAG: glycerol-3-phosphate 1-O-acyltransferase PlsY [Planctomycetota bacterium]|nr:glycerol-3-phosphate 1-O-acyltransferase PlsY [Planctomycetota bacterium]
MLPLALFDTTIASLAERPFVWMVIVIAYLLGAVPFGLILAKWKTGVDLRTMGSGNIGTTNAARAMGRSWGFVVFALDFLKGFAPVLLVHFFSGLDVPDDREFLQVLVGTASVLGHCYPVYLGFKGGKGVATGCGAIVAIDWRIFVIGGLVWVLTRLATGYAGLASILMGVAFPIAAFVIDWPNHRALVVGAALLTLLIVVRHRGNIQRMLQGTEPNARHKKEAARHG